MHPIAFEIGPLTIHWYGILVAAGFLVALITAQKRAPRAGLTSEAVSDVALWLIVGGIVGARALYVLSYWDEEFSGKPLWNIINLREGGLVFYGGFIGATLLGIIYVRIKKLPLWKLADVIAPSIPLGQAFGRIGCFMTGCCYGRPTDAFCAVRFPISHETQGTPVHPTQIYEAVGALALFVFLEWIFRKKWKFQGQVFSLYLIGYAIVRSVVELFRGDYLNYWFRWITPAHFISAGVLIAGLALYFFLRRSGTKASAAEST